MAKKWIARLLFAALLVLTLQSPALADGPDYYPIRSTFESMGYNVGWDSYQGQIIIENADDKMNMGLHDPIIVINGRQTALKKNLLISDGISYIHKSVLADLGFFCIGENFTKLSLPNQDNLKNTVLKLAMENRVAGTAKESLTAQFLSRQFEQYGFGTSIQNFEYKEYGARISKHSQNVIVSGKSTDSGKKVLIVGAHYDSVPFSPGAYDNASGVAVLLELSRLLSELECEMEIKFVAFGAEEPGLYGSSYFVRNLSQREKENIVAMINLDMLGAIDKSLERYTASGEENHLTLAFDPDSSEAVQAARSDHVSFDRTGIPSILFSDGETNYYHTPNDQPDKIDFDRLETITHILLEYIIKIANPSN